MIKKDEELTGIINDDLVAKHYKLIRYLFKMIFHSVHWIVLVDKQTQKELTSYITQKVNSR